MEQPEAIYSSSMRNGLFDMNSSRSGHGFDRKLHPPFQAIIDKGKQAKAQVEQDQYEARKAKRETEIKNAARIRHAEAEANRRCAEESKMSIDDHKGKLLDELTKNIKAMLEDQYREEIRAKVYENEDQIASTYEHDVKDRVKARLVKELEPVVKANLGAEFEPEIKQQLAVELISVVKAELRAKYETEVRHQLAKDLGSKVETELRAKYQTEVREQLARELVSEVKAELRAEYEEEIRNQLIIGTKSTINNGNSNNNNNNQKGTQTDDAQPSIQNQHEKSRTLERESFRATSNNINTKVCEYPDLIHHQCFSNTNGVQDGQLEAESVQNMESFEADGEAPDLPRGTKRSLGGIDDEEEEPHPHQLKRSRSMSSDNEEQQLRSGNEAGLSNPYSSEPHMQQSYQGVHYGGEDSQGLSQCKEDHGNEVAQRNSGYPVDRETLGYNSSHEAQGSHENSLGLGGVDSNSAGDDHEMNGDLLDPDWTEHDKVADIQGTNEDILYREEADYNSDEDFEEMDGTLSEHQRMDYGSAEDVQGTNSNFLDSEDASYDYTENIRGGAGYKMFGEATESYNSEEDEDEDEDEEEDVDDEGEYDEEYEGEEEDYYSTALQVTTHSNPGNGVISISNTQDTAFVLSDSDDEAEKAGDEEMTLVGYDGPAALIDAKHLDTPPETPFLGA